MLYLPVRCGYSPDAVLARPPSVAQDQALVQYVDSLCRHLGVSSCSVPPWDVTPSEVALSSLQFAPLQGQCRCSLVPIHTCSGTSSESRILDCVQFMDGIVVIPLELTISFYNS